MSLYVLMRLMGERVSVEDVKAVVPFDPEVGCSLASLARGASALGFATEIRFVPQGDLKRLAEPFIYHSEGSLKNGAGHFGVVAAHLSEKQRFVTIDPEFGTIGRVPEATVYDRYTGYVLIPKRSATSAWIQRSRISLLAFGTVCGGLVLIWRLRRDAR